jgi:predicted metal-dependent hydrolase
MNEDDFRIAGDPFHLRLVAPTLSSLPIVGGALSSLWTEWDSVRKTANIQAALDKLHELLADRLDQLEQVKLGIEDMQILDEMLQRVRRENSEGRRSRFAHSLAAAWTSQHALPFEEKMLFQKANSEFQDEHIKILQILERAGAEAGVPYTEFKESVVGHLATNEEKGSVLIPTLDCLASQYGFIRRGWGLNDPSYNRGRLLAGALSPEGIAMKCNHAIKPLGIRYLQSIRSSF